MLDDLKKIYKDINSSINVIVFKDGQTYEMHMGNSYNFNDRKELANRDTIYDIASNTKIYGTAMALMFLIEEGKLNFDTKIMDIFIDGYWSRKKQKLLAHNSFNTDDVNFKFKNRKIDQTHKQEITILNLMEHSSGFPPEIFSFNKDLYNSLQKSNFKLDEENINFEYFKSFSPDETANKLLTRYPIIELPNTKYIYSDVNYMLLGIIIETVTQMNLNKFIKKIHKKIGVQLLDWNLKCNTWSKI